MRKTYIPIFLILIISSLNIGCEQKQKVSDTRTDEQPNEDAKKEEVKDERPVMQINLTDGRQIDPRSLTEKSILIFFQPDCDHCQHEARDIQARLNSFTGYELYFVSSHPMEIINQFAKDYKLNNVPNVYFGSAPVESVLNNYGAISAPSIYIYNEQGKLTKSFNGQTDVEQIIQSL